MICASPQGLVRVRDIFIGGIALLLAGRGVTK